MTKAYNWGDYNFKGYFTKAGNGFEIGYKFNNKNYFVSNFIDREEATKWWTMSQKHMATFCKTEYFPNMNKAFFGNYMGNYMYTQYYSFLRGVIAKNYTGYTKNYKKDVTRFATYRNKHAV
ncbi:MAG: hypothetical protein WA160_00615 [Pseudobdellovibrio sp.]